MSSREIRERLKASHVPEYVWGSTLKDMGQGDLSEWVASGDYTVAGTPFMENLLLYPQAYKQSSYARHIAYLLAKELTLVGDSVFVVSLATLAAYVEDNISEKLAAGVENSVFLFVMDFFEEGAEFLLSKEPRTAYKVREFVKERLTKPQQSMVLHGDRLPSTINPRWWPESFVREIIQSSTVIELTDDRNKKKVVRLPRRRDA